MPIRVANWDHQQKLLYIDPDSAIQAGYSAKLGVEAASSAILSSLAFHNSYALRSRVHHEFHSLLPSIKGQIISWADNNSTGKCYDPSEVGALIHLITYIGDAPTGMPKPQGFVAILVADCGLDFQTVFTNYFTAGFYTPSAPANTDEKWSFLWYTLP